jgi:NDP-sugar pyrophosphorylase family protein
MIVIPMLGKSSRFSSQGYLTPKYMLPVGSATVFEHSVRSFQKHFLDEHFVFVVRRDHQAREFVARKAADLGIKDFRIKELAEDTRGQAETVFISINDYDKDQILIVFNIDTVRTGFELPNSDEFGDGFLEVFEGKGDGWSFVEPFPGTTDVIRTAEKVRISKYCSNGLYAFKKIADFRDAFQNTQPSSEFNISELYIAPLYNFLIEKGKKIKYHFVAESKIHHCGIPEDYEQYVRNHTSQL